MVEPTTESWRKKTRLSWAGGFGPDVAPQTTMRPPGLSDLSEWSHVAWPTGSMTASTRSGGRVADHRVDDAVATVLVDAGSVATEHHRQPVLGDPDTLERPEVVMVERRRPDLDRRPALRRLRLGTIAETQPRERVGGVDAV